MELSSAQEILRDYFKRQDVYEELGPKVEVIIKAALQNAAIQPHSITFRTKGAESLRKKIQDHPERKYENLTDLTDLLGVRIISYYIDEVDAIWEVMKKEFDLDEKNCVDKRETDNPNEFGYASLHLVASLGESRTRLSEYSRFSGMKFEIQIRTILQHAWAEIEHDHVYKTKSTVPPDMRRIFSRISAMLEAADLDFQRVRNVASERSQQQVVDESPLDGMTVETFAEDADFLSLEKELAPYWSKAKSHHKSDEYLRRYIPFLHELGVKTIGSLRRELKRNRNRILSYSVDRSKFINNEEYPIGWSLMQLAQILFAEQGRLDGIERVIRRNYEPTPGDIQGRSNALKRILEVTPQNEP